MVTTNPFVLSIEPVEGKSFVHGFHLGTDERVARQFAEEKYRATGARTVALMRDWRIWDVFDGSWFSEQGYEE